MVASHTHRPRAHRALAIALLIAVIAIASSGWRTFADATPAPSPALTGAARVIDGDTLQIASTRIRLWGVDAPERRQRCADGAPGAQATRALDDIIAGHDVSCRARDRDRYGRTVAECRAGGVDLGARMVQEGWAWDYTHYSHGHYQAEEIAPAPPAAASGP